MQTTSDFVEVMDINEWGPIQHHRVRDANRVGFVWRARQGPPIEWLALI